MTIADRFIGRFRFGSVRFTAGTHSQFNNDYNNNINVVASPHVIYIYRHAHSATLKRERFYFSMLYTLFKGNTRRTIYSTERPSVGARAWKNRFTAIDTTYRYDSCTYICIMYNNNIMM